MVQALGWGLGSCSGPSLQPWLRCLLSSPCSRLSLPLDVAPFTPSPTRADLKMTRGCLLQHQPASGHLEQPCARAGAVNLLGLRRFHLHVALIYFFFPLQCLQPQLSKIA